MPCKSRQYIEEGCRNNNGHLFKQLDYGYSQARLDLLRIQTSLLDIPPLEKNNQNLLTVMNIFFFSKRYSFNKNKGLQGPLWFRETGKSIIHQLNERFWSCHYLWAKWCINSDTQRFTVMSLETVNLDSIMYFPELSWNVWTSLWTPRMASKLPIGSLLVGIFGAELNFSWIIWSLWTCTLRSLLQDIIQRRAIYYHFQWYGRMLINKYFGQRDIKYLSASNFQTQSIILQLSQYSV